MKLKEFCVQQGWAIGFAEVRRAVSAGSIFINDLKADSADELVTEGDVVKFGKRKEATVEEILV